MTTRITPYTAGGSIAERIDEIVIERPSVVHIEMTCDSSAFAQLGEHRILIEARRGQQLVIREER